MKFSELPGQRLSVRVLPTDRIAFSDQLDQRSGTMTVLTVEPTSAEGQFGLALRDSYIHVRPVSETEAQRLNDELLHGRAMLAQLSDPGVDGSAELSVVFFTGQPNDLGDVEVGLDEYVIRGAQRLGRQSARKVPGWIRTQFVYEVDGLHYFFFAAGPAIGDVLAAAQVNEGAGSVELYETSSAENSDEPTNLPHELASAPRVDQTTKNSFMLVGTDARFVATDTPVGHGQSIYVATKITARSPEVDPTIRLARGKLKFVDWSEAGQIGIRSRAQLASLTLDESSYMRKWDEFGDLEGTLLLDQAREIGLVRFTTPTENRDGTVTIQITDASDSAFDALRSGNVEALELVDAVPSYLSNTALTFAEFSRQIALGTSVGDLTRQGRDDRVSGTTIPVGRFDNESLRLTLQIERLSPDGMLVLSLQGEIAQIRRRHAARRAILEGRSANPQLGLLIEEKGEITSMRSPQKVAPLTAFVRDKVFRNDPTVMQEKAIEVALNTPDIALIQGPPGTGKTTVIAAILERLNENASKSGRSLKGRVLLTGFQHDAVENMIDRISLNSIPVPKFGKPTGTDDSTESFERNLEVWCKQIANELRERNPQFADIEHEADIRDLYQQYLQGPSRRLALAFVTRIAALNVSDLGEDLSRTATRLLHRLQAEDTTSVSGLALALVAAARRLRVRAESFADDGPERAEDALVDLEFLLTADERGVLDKASLWTQSRGTPPFLGELGDAKKSLLQRLTAPPEFRVEKQSDEVLGLGRRVLDRLRTHGHAASDRKSAALAQFLAELENNPWGMVDAVAEYSYAFAATVQQSVNKEMQRRKGLSAGESQDLEYDYVIIDEAARVSPRDLMIPMSQGKRIILVGDHRQLPHLIDEAVAHSMESGEAGPTESEWLKRSMFEYLFAERLKALETHDGITRRVTLDQQFRMHPVLGGFISRNFYERFDPAERFGSGLPEGHFAHNLPDTQARPAMWLPVTSDEGPSRRSGTSWIRQAEADRIVQQIRDWIRSPEGDSLTYGVISFYKAQANLIRDQLRERLGDIADDKHRIRVGTVDSFQGMEFDVVFLSVVRTVAPNWSPRSADAAVNARQLFGHLGLYNRLNVSMSRQKRLLVAVGDPALVQHDLAAEHIPGLVDFYRLAGEASPTPRSPADTATVRSPLASPAPLVVDMEQPPPKGQPPTNDQPPTEEERHGFFGRLFGRGRGDV